MKIATAAALATLLAACSSPSPTNQTAPVNEAAIEEVPVAEGDVMPEAAPANATAPRAPDYAGRWTGVEGMYLAITAKPTPGQYTLEMQYDLDNKATVDGRATDDGIAFERGGKTLTLRPTDGAATGLKYLAGKADCLTVASGEGYCRD